MVACRDNPVRRELRAGVSSVTFCTHGDSAATFVRTADSPNERDSAMGSMVSGLADAVLGVVEGVGLSGDTVARYGKSCDVVAAFCERRDLAAFAFRGVD